MRWLAAALALIAATNAARADIRINESRYVDGSLIVNGETAPNRAVTLDNKYKTKSDGGGFFTFTVSYKPFTCMTDIRSGDDIYSAVIAGCLDAGDVDAPLPAKPDAKAPKQ
ncbi:MAG TPA: hypothetical protein VFW22_15110 [Pseudolabrys sp.]|nr:hypothetical protein [Pseudolabrys sp.]